LPGPQEHKKHTKIKKRKKETTTKSTENKAECMLEIKLMVVHFQGQAFNPSHLLVYQLEDAGVG
jgi:hypothetical protein